MKNRKKKKKEEERWRKPKMKKINLSHMGWPMQQSPRGRHVQDIAIAIARAIFRRFYTARSPHGPAHLAHQLARTTYAAYRSAHIRFFHFFFCFFFRFGFLVCFSCFIFSSSFLNLKIFINLDILKSEIFFKI